MNNGNDGGGGGPDQNNNNANNFNPFPFQMPPYFPQQPYLQNQGIQHFDELMDNFNTSNSNDAQLMQRNNQFAYSNNSNNNMRAAGSNMNQQISSQQVNGRQHSSSMPADDPPLRAAELKRKLMAMRKDSETSPNNNSSSPNLPKSSKPSEPPKGQGTSDHTIHSQPGDTDLENLLSEARSAADNTAAESPAIKIKGEQANMENVRPASQTPTNNPAAPATNGSRPKPSEKAVPILNKFIRRTSERSLRDFSEMSDGEIVDEPKPRRPLPPTGPKESELSVVKRKQAEDQVARDRRDDLPIPEKIEPTNTKLHRSPTLTSSQPAVTRSYRDERSDVAEPRASSRRTYEESGNIECKPRVEEKRFERREDPVVESRNAVKIRGGVDRGSSKSPPQVPLLERVLTEDDDLRTWLDMTGYHDITERETKLNKYREWLKAYQKSQELQAEMGGIFRAPTVIAARTPSVGTKTMLPPPTPTKVTHENTDTHEDKSMIIRRSDNSGAASTLGRKRSLDDSGQESPEKFARTGSEGQRAKVKTEGPGEYRRPDAPRRSYGDSESTTRYKRDEDRRGRSVSPRPNRPDGSGGVREFDDHGRGRSFNQQDHDMTDVRAYENRPPPRNLSRDGGAQKINNDDWKSRRLHESMDSGGGSEYNTTKGYRGRNWDPHYHENRGRGSSINGRGRGRGGVGGSDMSFSSTNDNAGPQGPRSYGNGSAMKPRGYKEAWNRGGKGETRFFILKSYNEENILHCQKDSVWTTQEHNADVLTKAFNTCKNVIFCFSINASKHFQGYARMESLPGSEPPPTWQNKIRFATAGAFRVKWLTVANTHFSRVGHLKNGLNEGAKVYVGKDGQEIEEGAGKELCGIIDEEFEHRYKGGWGSEGGEEGSYGGEGRSGGGGRYGGAFNGEGEGRGGGFGRGEGSDSGHWRGRGGFSQQGRGDGFAGRGDGRGYRTYREPGGDVGDIRGW